MIHQEFFQSNNSNIILVYNFPTEIDRIVLLVPGFLECGSDKEYFFTRLSNILNQSNIMTVQLEPFAHGYSYGNTLDFTLEKVKNNVVEVLEMLKKKYKKNICLITNGVYSSLINDLDIINSCREFICVNPTFISKQDLDCILSIKSDTFELADYVLNNKKILDVFLRLGASTYNICSQLFKKESIVNMLLYSKNNQEKVNDKACYIYSDYELNEVYMTRVRRIDSKNYFTAFSDPILIYKICLVVKNILEVKNEDSI